MNGDEMTDPMHAKREQIQGGTYLRNCIYKHQTTDLLSEILYAERKLKTTLQKFKQNPVKK